MEIEQEQRGGIRVVTPRGRIDSTTSTLFEQQIMGLLQEGDVELVLNFQHIDYISSAGLRVLLMAAKRLKPRGGRVVLCAIQPHIQEVFRISGFVSLFQFHASLDDLPAR
ncbi:MAG: STAS domain-containing protein [Magnetococcus sp. MYC-9]